MTIRAVARPSAKVPPIIEFSYDDTTGELQYEVIGYDYNIVTGMVQEW